MKYYLRYGDDFLIMHNDRQKLLYIRKAVIKFLEDQLCLQLKNDFLLPVKHSLKFLGVVMNAGGKRLNRRNIKRISRKLSSKNVGSYHGLILQHGTVELLKEFQWRIVDVLIS